MLGDEEDIDPVVVSSCIFMDDERSETQADGIVNKVSLVDVPVLQLSTTLTQICVSD